MDELRERFDEAAAMILEALRTGFIEGDGKFYKQPRTPIRPKPERSFADRTYAVASSRRFGRGGGAAQSAHGHVRRPALADAPAADRAAPRRLFRQFHGEAAPPFLIADFCVCTPTMDGAEDLAKKHMASFVDSNLEHYEILTGHFAASKATTPTRRRPNWRRKPAATASSRRS